MKKKLSVLLAMSVICVAVLAGCGKSEGPKTINDTKKEETKGSGKLAEKQEMTFILNNEPGNAEEWESNDDLTVWTFQLRDGLKWSDGSALTAKDYVYSALRVLTPETTGQYVNMISDYVVNAQEYYDGKVSAEEVGIKAVNDTTLEFTLKAPCPYFVDLVSMWVYFPVQEATIAANGDKWVTKAESYVGNGPFKITEMKTGESMTLEKNENYWGADDVTLEKLTYRYILDTSTSLTAYEGDEVDGVRKSEVIQLFDAAQKGFMPEWMKKYPNGKLLMRLFKGDVIGFIENRKYNYYTIKGISIADQNLKLLAINKAEGIFKKGLNILFDSNNKNSAHHP